MMQRTMLPRSMVDSRRLDILADRLALNNERRRNRSSRASADGGPSGLSTEAVPAPPKDTHIVVVKSLCMVDGAVNERISAIAAIPAPVEAAIYPCPGIPAPVEAAIPAPVEAAVIGVDPALIHEGVFSREVAGISSLQNTGLELSIALSRGNWFSRLIADENHLVALLTLPQMKNVIFYYYYCLKLEDHAWKSHSTLAASITIRMMPRTTIGREVQSAKNRIRFDQGERCRGTYSQLLLTLLHHVAELWIMLEEQQGIAVGRCS